MQLRIVYKEDDYATPEEVDITASRFVIGRSADNDFVIDDSNLSRRHALVENFDGVYFLSDCGSQNGTTLNGNPVTGPVQLHNGDVILLGGTQEFRVQLFDPQAEKPQEQASSKQRPKSVSIKSGTTSSHRDKATTSVEQTTGLSVKTIQILISVIAVSVVLIIGAIAIILIGTGVGGRNKNVNTRQVNNIDDNSNEIVENSPQPNTSPAVNQPNDNSTPPLPTPDPKLNNVEAAAKQFLLKFNTKDKVPYAFDEKTLNAINARAEQFRNSAQLTAAFKNIQSNGSAIIARALNEGMEPALPIFTGLALTNGGQNGNALEAANKVFDTLNFVRITIGEGDVDSSLLVVAAHLEGPGVKKSHPMLSRMRDILQDNRTQRNVWYMHEHKTKGGQQGVSDNAYNLVVTLVAIGAISQNPQLFGVNTAPLNF